MPTQTSYIIDNSNLLKKQETSILDDFSCVRDFQREYGSQHLLASGINGFTNNISEKSLRVIRQENLNCVIISHLNINSIRNKFDLLANQIVGRADILVISKTKLDFSFPIEKFKIPSFSIPFRRDRDQYGGGLLFFVREDTS